MLRRLNGPAVAGIIALVVSGWLLWLTLQDDDQPAGLGSSLLVNKAGGYSIRVPEGMKPTKRGKVTRIVDEPRTVLITIAPTRSGPPAETSTAVLAKMRTKYRTVDLASSQRQTVDGHVALASYGRATTKEGVDLRFVLITVKSRNRSFALSSLAAADSDPATTLPQLRAVVNGFHARPR